MVCCTTIQILICISRSLHISQICRFWISIWWWSVSSRCNKLFKFLANINSVTYSETDLTGWLRDIPLRFNVSKRSTIVKSTISSILIPVTSSSTSLIISLISFELMIGAISISTVSIKSRASITSFIASTVNVSIARIISKATKTFSS